MIQLAWRWCEILGIDPHRHPHLPVAEPGQFAGQLAAAITDYLATAAGVTADAYLNQQTAGRHGPPAAWTRRDPTPDEQRAARHLADRLRRARTAHPEPATAPSPIPPGRLRTRQAITAQAQAATGTLPTAQPWQRRTSLPPAKPTLHLGVLVDVSGSMHAYAKAMSSAGWILAHAAHRNQAVTATIAFAGRTTLLVPPRQRPNQVLEMATGGGTNTFPDAVKLADRLLNLRHHRRLRMLAVVSDGDLDDPEPAQRLIATLHRTGCAVLWLQPAGSAGQPPFQHTTTITVTNPVDAIGHVADAAVTALTNA
jgi:Mg-chelatase subunit ChlD